MKISVFKTEAAGQNPGYYSQVLSQFPFGQQYADTTYGRTFMLTAGRNQIHPSSCAWFMQQQCVLVPEIMALSNNYRVYAVDIIVKPETARNTDLTLTQMPLRSG
jgi:hypothetical protein